MEENTIDYILPNFTGHRCTNGEARQGEREEEEQAAISAQLRAMSMKEYSDSIRRRFTDSCSISIYPNGNKPEHSDYVSFAFDIAVCHFEKKDYLDEMKRYRDETVLLVCVVSVVDSDGKLRFPQTFEIDLERGPLQSLLPVEVDRFVSRRVLMDASEELLPGDRLKLRCDVCHFFSVDYCENQSYVQFCENLQAVAYKESWYTETENGDLALDLRNADSPLCTRLRKRSEFFRGLFRSALKEMEDGYMPIEEFESHAFQDMLGYVRFGSTLHLRLYYQFEDVYEQACMYGVRDLEDICIDYFKRNLTVCNVVETLRIADSRGDPELKGLAFEKALANWNYVQCSEDWKDLCLEWPQLSDELSRAALNSENAASLSRVPTVLPERNPPNWAEVFEERKGKKRFVGKVRLRKGNPAKKCARAIDYDFDRAINYDFYR